MFISKFLKINLFNIIKILILLASFQLSSNSVLAAQSNPKLHTCIEKNDDLLKPNKLSQNSTPKFKATGQEEMRMIVYETKQSWTTAIDLVIPLWFSKVEHYFYDKNTFVPFFYRYGFSKIISNVACNDPTASAILWNSYQTNSMKPEEAQYLLNAVNIEMYSTELGLKLIDYIMLNE
jgi:hypothetical protein